MRIYGIPDDAHFFPEVPLAPLGARGDIDILGVSPQAPEAATAIQVKRVKVPAKAFRSGKPNKVAAIEELHRQATLLATLGFHQVFSYAIVVVDSRENNGGEFTFDGLTPELRSTIECAMTLEGLHSNAGFIHFEICQPVDDWPLDTGTFSGQIRRMPTPQIQSQAVTRFVQAVLRASDA